MSGGSNATVSYPGDGWQMLWPADFSTFQLDIVGFLAILGEGSVLANAQVSALSGFFYFPRLMPAPQALLRPTRPLDLPRTAGTVTGVYSGNVKDHVHHVAHLLLGDEMKTFTVRCVNVKRREQLNEPSRRSTFGLMQAKTRSPTMGTPLVTAKATGPLAWVTLVGFALSVALFALSILFGDGMSMIATILLSLLSTLVGIGNKWNLKLPETPKGGDPPEGDVVVRWPNGSYLVVRCNEEVARALYFAPEEIDYVIKNEKVYRLISLVGTLMLMLGVIALANARLELQFAWAGAYIFINAAHWVAAAMPSRLHWDLSCYEITEESLAGGASNPTFTEALWKAILLTKSTLWVKNGKAAPMTPVWDDWLKAADAKAQERRLVIGEAIDPLWKEGNTAKATIWIPPEGWSAKDEWNRLNKLHHPPKFTQ